jgi:anhydro-N-acetylmuramic acid kinase
MRPGEEPIAYDTGPANALLDLAIAAGTGGAETCDRDGARAHRGRVDRTLLEHLLAEPFYALPPPKTTGKELFHTDYLGSSDLPLDDLLATLAALTTETVARELDRYGVKRVVASGGGTRNRAIMDGLAARLPGVELETFDRLGVASEAKEAVVFALIGFLTTNGLAGALPSCTGATRATLLGTITPGRGALVLPPPARVRPTQLVLDGGVKAVM